MNGLVKHNINTFWKSSILENDDIQIIESVTQKIHQLRRYNPETSNSRFLLLHTTIVQKLHKL